MTTQLFTERLLTELWFGGIIQEVVVNPDVILICGSICISWTRLVAAFSNLQERGDTILSFHQTERIEPLKRIANLWFHHSMSRAGFLGMFGGPKPQNLFDMVESFWAYECRDARDRIYALYSLSSTTSVSASPEHAGITIDVDYRRSIRRVYQDFTIACLDSDEVDYRQVIKAAILRNDSFQSDDWPSWVPDWRIKPAGYANLPEIRGIHGPADPDRLLITLPTQWISVPGCELVQVTNVATAWIGVDAASQHGNFMSTLPSIIRILKSLGSMSEVTAYEILLQLLQGRHHDIRIGQHSLLHERLRSYLMDLWNEHLLPQKIQHLAEQYRDVIAELEPKTENIHFFTAQREHMGDVQTAFGLAGVMPKIGDEILAHSGGYDDLNQTISSAFVLRPGKNKAEDQNTVLRSYRLVGNATITLPFVDGQRTTYDDSPRPRYSSFYLE